MSFQVLFITNTSIIWDFPPIGNTELFSRLLVGETRLSRVFHERFLPFWYVSDYYLDLVNLKIWALSIAYHPVDWHSVIWLCFRIWWQYNLYYIIIYNWSYHSNKEVEFEGAYKALVKEWKLVWIILFHISQFWQLCVSKLKSVDVVFFCKWNSFNISNLIYPLIIWYFNNHVHRVYDESSIFCAFKS